MKVQLQQQSMRLRVDEEELADCWPANRWRT
jgi:hypothetical protein